MDTKEQERRLLDILSRNDVVWNVIQRLDALMLPDASICAGCITQTVWNDLHGFSAMHGMKDMDIVYFDATDLSEETERAHQGRVRDMLAVPIEVDLNNEARVHLWYGQEFGFSIPPYENTEHAIRTFPTTASAIGLFCEDGGLRVFAPFGLSDLFDGIVRPNKAMITREIYERKASAWKAKWPKLTVCEW